MERERERERAEIATRRSWNDGADLNDGIDDDGGVGGEVKVFLYFARRTTQTCFRTGNICAVNAKNVAEWILAATLSRPTDGADSAAAMR